MIKGIFTSRAWLWITVLALFSLSSTAFSASPGKLLSYELTHDMLPTPDRFSVTVYQDGVAWVHYPEFMQHAGDYTVDLSPSEVQKLRLLLEHPLVQKFNPAAAKEEKKQIDSLSAELFEVSDDSWSNFQIHDPGSSKEIRWANVSVDAMRYPEIGVFRKLADIEAELLRLAEHPTATAVVD